MKINTEQEKAEIHIKRQPSVIRSEDFVYMTQKITVPVQGYISKIEWAQRNG